MHLVNILRIITFSFLVGHSILTISDFNSFRVFLGHLAVYLYIYIYNYYAVVITTQHYNTRLMKTVTIHHHQRRGGGKENYMVQQEC